MLETRVLGEQRSSPVHVEGASLVERGDVAINEGCRPVSVEQVPNLLLFCQFAHVDPLARRTFANFSHGLALPTPDRSGRSLRRLRSASPETRRRPGSRNGGAVSRKRLRPFARSHRREFVEVPHLAERDAQLEQAVVVDGQERVPARSRASPSHPLDRVLSPTSAEIPASVIHSSSDWSRPSRYAQRVDLHGIRVAAHLQDLRRPARVQQQRCPPARRRHRRPP